MKSSSDKGGKGNGQYSMVKEGAGKDGKQNGYKMDAVQEETKIQIKELCGNRWKHIVKGRVDMEEAWMKGKHREKTQWVEEAQGMDRRVDEESTGNRLKRGGK